MEVNSGIIIDGVLHEPVQDEIGCEKCSLLSVCQKFNVVCGVIGCEAFVNRGKVTAMGKFRIKKRVCKYGCVVQVRKWYGWVTIKEFRRILHTPGNIKFPEDFAQDLLDKLKEDYGTVPVSE